MSSSQPRTRRFYTYELTRDTIIEISLSSVLETPNANWLGVTTHAPGPGGALPLSAEMLLTEPSGNLFGLSQNAGMGWDPARLLDPEFLILSTHGGLRAEDGRPVALGFHTGHWEVGLLVAEAARELKALRAVPFAGACTDPCDGRTQGTTGMMDSLPFRNDAAVVLRRLMRSLPTGKGVLGIATCDKGLPAMMMALASAGPLPAVLVPGGVTLLPETGEDAGKVQTIGARFAQQQITLEYAADVGCRACASPGGGCQFLGTAATSQVVGEALGLSLPHAALAPSGQPIWLDAAKRSARALRRMQQIAMGVQDVLTPGALRNAMVLHAAFGGSTNLLIHLPAIAFSAGLKRPTVDEWAAVNREVPRLVDALPNGPRGFATVQVFLAGGVPEVMLELRAAGLLDTRVKTVSGETLDACLDWWRESGRRKEVRQRLKELDGIDPDEVILDRDRARARGLSATVCFPLGNLAPEGSVIKSTAIDASLVDADGVYRHVGPARVFVTEADAIHAIGLNGKDRIVLRLPGMLRLHDVSRDGRVLLTKESWRSGLQFRAEKDAKERDFSWLDYAQLRDLSADGAQIVFDDWGSAAGASGLAYVRKADGSPAIKLGEWSIPTISPDGTQVLAFEATAVGTSHPVLIPTGAGETHMLTSTLVQQSNAMGFMPDQTAVYFSDDDGHGWRMYIQEVAGGAARAVTPVISIRTHYFESHVVSPDGKLMFARDLRGKGVLYPIAGGEARLVPGWLPEDVWITWSTDGRSVYVYQDEKTSAPVYRIDLTTGKRDLVTTLAPSDSAGVTAIVSVRMTADGKTYAYSFSRELSDLFVVTGVR